MLQGIYVSEIGDILKFKHKNNLTSANDIFVVATNRIHGEVVVLCCLRKFSYAFSFLLINVLFS